MTDPTESDDIPICEDECVTWGGHADNCRVPAAIRALEAKVRVEARRGDRWQNAHEEQRKALERTHHMLRNLLARIHRDGGHYAAEHGLEKATEDADQIVAEVFADRDHWKRSFDNMAGDVFEEKRRHAVTQFDRDRLAGEVERLNEMLAADADSWRAVLAARDAEVARLTSELAAARENEARWLWMFPDDALVSVTERMQRVYRKWDGCDSWNAAVDAARRAGGEG